MEQGKYFEVRGADDFFFRNIDAQRTSRSIEGLTDEVLLHFQDRLFSGGNLAVLGGSAGAVSMAFHKKFANWKVSNVDLSPAALEFGRQQFPQLEHVLADISDPSLASLLSPQDCVVFPTVLCWIGRDQLRGVVENVKAILKPGGILAIEDFFPTRPRVVPIRHQPGAFTYKQNYDDLFLQAGDFVVRKKCVWVVDDKDYELEDRFVGYALLQRSEI